MPKYMRLCAAATMPRTQPPANGSRTMTGRWRKSSARGQNHLSTTSIRTGSNSLVPLPLSVPRPSSRPLESSVLSRPDVESKSAFHCRLRACHFSCFASSFEKGGTMKSERSLPSPAAGGGGARLGRLAGGRGAAAAGRAIGEGAMGSAAPEAEAEAPVPVAPPAEDEQPAAREGGRGPPSRRTSRFLLGSEHCSCRRGSCRCTVYSTPRTGTRVDAAPRRYSRSSTSCTAGSYGVSCPPSRTDHTPDGEAAATGVAAAGCGGRGSSGRGCGRGCRGRGGWPLKSRAA